MVDLVREEIRGVEKSLIGLPHKLLPRQRHGSAPERAHLRKEVGEERGSCVLERERSSTHRSVFQRGGGGLRGGSQ